MEPTETRVTNPPLVEAIASFTAAQRTVAAGAHLSSDDEMVRKFPQYFIRVDAPDDEKHHARWEATYGQLKYSQPAAPPPPPRRPTVNGMEVAAGPFTVPDYEADRGATRVVYPGDRYAPDHRLVQEFPHIFRPVVEQR